MPWLGILFPGIVRKGVGVRALGHNVAGVAVSVGTYMAALRYVAIPHFLSDCIPATWGVEGFIRMNTNGASLSQVSGDYLHLWLLAAVYLVLGYCVQRWVVRPLS